MNQDAIKAAIAYAESDPLGNVTDLVAVQIELEKFAEPKVDLGRTAARILLAELRHVAEAALKWKAYANRLEEAGDKMHWAFMHPFDTAHESVPDAWGKAKEAKP